MQLLFYLYKAGFPENQRGNQAPTICLPYDNYYERDIVIYSSNNNFFFANNNFMKSNKKAYLSGVIMSLIIGLQYIVIKNILTIFGNNVFLLLAIRFFLSLIPFMFLFSKLNFHMILNKKVIFLSLIQPFMNLNLQTYGVQMLNVTTVGYLTALNPIFNLAASLLFLKERINKKQVFYILLAVAGCFLASYSDKGVVKASLFGIALIIGSLILRSLYSVKSKQLSVDCSAINITFCQLLWGFILFSAASLISGQISNIQKIIINMSFTDILSLLYLSLMSLTMAYFLNNYVISKITVITTGILNNLTFLVTLLSGVLFRNEIITTISIFGSFMILIGIIMAAKERAKMERCK